MEPGGSHGRTVAVGAMIALTLALLTVPVALGQRMPHARASTVRLHECQHPVRTGVEVFNLRRVSVATACRVALGLHTYVTTGRRQVARCTGPHRTTPVLTLHRFDGWTASIQRSGFVFSRGPSRFGVGGTDFPLDCF